MPNMSLHTLMQHSVTNMTIVPYLGLIEQRAAEIINAFLAFRGACNQLLTHRLCTPANRRRPSHAGAQSIGQGLPTIPPKSATPVVPPPKPYAAAQAVVPVRILTMPADHEEPDDIDEGGRSCMAFVLGKPRLI